MSTTNEAQGRAPTGHAPGGGPWVRARELADRVASAMHLDELPVLLEQPLVTIDLMLGATEGNDPFFASVVRDFHREARAPHPRLPVVGRLAFGVALCRLPATYPDYFHLVDGSARRNVKKAERDGYRFERIDFNDHLDDIAAIRRSTDVRQGPMPESLLQQPVTPVSDPPTRTNVHDYPWFGVLRDGHLVAYASCFVAGEVCLINHILGHAAHQDEGVVPRLILGIAEYVYGHYPRVKFLGYDTWFGASPSLRRFKRKLGFAPYRVRWELGEGHAPGLAADPVEAAAPPVPRFGEHEPVARISVEIPAHLDYQLVYRQRVRAPVAVEPVQGASFHYLDNPVALAALRGALAGRFPPAALVKALAKLGTPRRNYYCVVERGAITSDGWVMWGSCRHYHIEQDDAVIGPAWTDATRRGHGLATFALRSALNAIHARGGEAVWIDTSRDNLAMQRVIARCGFGAPASVFVRAPEQPTHAAVPEATKGHGTTGAAHA